MNATHLTWTSHFQSTYNAALDAYRTGHREPSSIVSQEQSTFLHSIGCSAQELYDYVEDFHDSGEPDFETVLCVTSLRRYYFLHVLGGKHPSQKEPSSTLPPKDASVDGIVWLPRIIEKAKRKLRGTMDADLMYGCGGDRRFFREHQIHSADFLLKVWLSEGNDQAVVDWVKQKPTVRV